MRIVVAVNETFTREANIMITVPDGAVDIRKAVEAEFLRQEKKGTGRYKRFLGERVTLPIGMEWSESNYSVYKADDWYANLERLALNVEPLEEWDIQG